MPSPLNVKRNNYHKNTKNSTVKTPLKLASQLFDIIHRQCLKSCCDHVIFDPCVGDGAMIEYFKRIEGYFILGVDRVDWGGCDAFYKGNFLEMEKGDFEYKPDYVLMNPPFNRDEKNKEWLKRNKLGNALIPELFLDHVFKLWGPRTKVVMIAPMGFLFNQREGSKRWQKYRDSKAQITSFMPLPLDVFEGVEFHSGVLFWNISGLKPHYSYGEDV
jgi:type I restriction enzyme M protein